MRAGATCQKSEIQHQKMGFGTYLVISAFLVGSFLEELKGVKSTLSSCATLEVGEKRRVENFQFIIVKIKLRGEGFADAAEAKDIVRVWGREI